MQAIEKIIEKYLEEFKNVGKKEKIVIILIIALLFFASFILSLFSQNFITSKYSKKIASAMPSPTPVPLPASISLILENKDIELGKEISVKVKINSPNQGIEATNIVIDYDPSLLTVKNIENGGYFKELLNKEIKDNQIVLRTAGDLQDRGIIVPKGDGNIAVIYFEPVSLSSKTSIVVNKKDTVIAVNGKNILDKVYDLNFSIN